MWRTICATFPYKYNTPYNTFPHMCTRSHCVKGGAICAKNSQTWTSHAFAWAPRVRSQSPYAINPSFSDAKVQSVHEKSEATFPLCSTLSRADIRLALSTRARASKYHLPPPIPPPPFPSQFLAPGVRFWKAPKCSMCRIFTNKDPMFVDFETHKTSRAVCR